VFLASCDVSIAQSDRTRPIRVIVPFEPGGQVDLMARLIAENLSKHLARSIIVDNRAGASGLIAMKIALGAAADATTLVLGSASTMALLPHAGGKPPYDPSRDFTAITLIATSPYVLVVQSSSPIQTVTDLIQSARSRPNTLAFGSAGHLSGTRVTTELFNAMTGLAVIHVAYKGSGPATVALLGGQVSFLFNNLLPSLPHIGSGRLRALGVTTERRNRALPDVPTIAESGVSGYEAGAWNGLVAPGHSPRSDINALNKAVLAVLAMPKVKAAISDQGSEIIGSTPEEFADFVKRENAKWSAVIAKIRLE